MILSNSPGVIDTQMQLEAKEPINRGFATGGFIRKHFVLREAAVVTDFDTGRIHKTDAATLAKTRAQVGAHWH